MSTIRRASFDVFDTLLVRPFARPSDLFTYVARTCPPRGLLVHRVPYRWFRMGAEALARCLRFPREDITLEDIFRVVGWFATNAGDLMAAELEAEFRLCRPWPPMVALFKEFEALGRRPVVISDMYLPASFLGRLLEAHGIHPHGVFVSSEAGLRKGTGHLFEDVRRREGDPFEAWVHVGDHPVSDQARPRSLGMEVIPVAPFRPEVRARGLLASAMAGLGWQAGGEGFWMRAGAQWVGPLVLGYARLLAVRVRELKVKRVLFAGGESWLVKDCFQRLCPGLDVGYLEPPRKTSGPAPLPADPAWNGLEGEVALVGSGWRGSPGISLAEWGASFEPPAHIHRLSFGPTRDGALPDPSFGVLDFLFSGPAQAPWEGGGDGWNGALLVRREIGEGVSRFLDAFLDVFSEEDFRPDEFRAYLDAALRALLADREMAEALARAIPGIPASCAGSSEAPGQC